MKKMKKLVLQSGVHMLDRAEQMKILGSGDFDPNVCHSKSSRYTCSGDCVDYEGHPGTCAWVDYVSSCKCAVVFIG